MLLHTILVHGYVQDRNRELAATEPTVDPPNATLMLPFTCAANAGISLAIPTRNNGEAYLVRRFPYLPHRSHAIQ